MNYMNHQSLTASSW